MNILLCHNLKRTNETQVTFSAVDYYRMQKPIQVLNRMFPEFKYATVDSMNVPDEFLKEFDLVIFSRVIPNAIQTVGHLNAMGITVALDLDDYWHLPSDHILSPSYLKSNVPQQIIDSIKEVSFVTCTTIVLADEIYKHNKNVYVLPNGIDAAEKMWQPNRTASDRIRFGFTGGQTHHSDLYLIADQVARSIKDGKFFKNAQFCLCHKAERGEGSMFVAYEKMLTDNHKSFDKYYPEYSRDLKLYLSPDGKDKPYRQIPFREIDEFGHVYDEIDVVVAPLVDNLFNRCKSNIKMLEAGFKGCAVMVSEISPYVPLATRDNSFLLSDKNFFEWQRYILLNPGIVKDRAEALAESVKPYELSQLVTKRKEVYESRIGMFV